jgi:hypothetical protein
MSYWYRSVLGTVARHAEVRVYIRYTDGNYVGTLVGYEGDVRYAEYLWTAALLMFSTKIDPVWSDDRSEAENIYLLRNAGIERRKIANMAGMDGSNPSVRSKIQRVYLRECASRGEIARASGLSHQTQTYREAYAASFRDTLTRRLAEARDAADSIHGAMVLHGRSDRVDEAFYNLFPIFRPSDKPAPKPVPCEKCKAAKSGTCRAHTYRWTKADEVRWQRMNNSPSARAGQASGVDAANGVDLVRGTTAATRVTGPAGELM